MQKILKRISLAIALALSVLCLCAFVTACDKATDYNITVVYSDGTAVDGTKDGQAEFDESDKTVTVQLCVVKKDGVTGSCYSKATLGADGKVTLAAPSYALQDGEKFKIQVDNVTTKGYTYDTVYAEKPGSYTVTIKK